jgi:hypothetical protein
VFRADLAASGVSPLVYEECQPCPDPAGTVTTCVFDGPPLHAVVLRTGADWLVSDSTVGG